VLLLDEPFAQIDALTRGGIQEELVRMWSATRNTVFMVTHDVDEAILLSDRIALMTNGPEAELAEIIDVTIPRPRTRAELIDSPDYVRIRNHVLHFLVKGAKKERHTGTPDSPKPSNIAPLPDGGAPDPAGRTQMVNTLAAAFRG
jgi:nitrate/nitrite transport system ATP-binding protein